MSDGKFDVRYSNKGIICVIILLTLFSALISEFIFKSGFISNINGNLYDNYYSSVNYSLYDDNVNYLYNQAPEGIKFALRSYKIDNFSKTKKFIEMYPNTVEGKDKEKAYEEPQYRTSFLSNIDGININENPQEYVPKTDIKHTFYVKGYYENGKVIFTEKSVIPKNYEKECNSLLKSVKAVYNNVEPVQNGIEKINFIYFIDFASKEYNEYINFYNNIDVLFPSIFIGSVITFVLMCAYVMISNYKKLNDVGFVTGIKKFPVEIVIILCSLWFIPVAGFGQSMENFSNLSRIPLYIFQMFVMFFALIAIYYIVLGLKSIYNEGLNSFVFSNSIIVRLIKGIGKILKKGVNNKNVDFSDNSKNKVILISAGLVIIGTLASIWFVDKFSPVIWVLWMILVFIFYKSSLKIALDIQTLTEASKEIREGNYDINVDVNNSSLKELATNLNKISSNLSSAIDDAVKSERMKTELITNVSHDLKTPLTAIINYSDLLNNNNLTEDQISEYSNIIYEKSNKLKYLIEDLFEVSKASSGNIDLSLELINIKLLLMQIAGEWDDKLEEKNISVVSNFPNEAVMINLDANKTSRVFDNLMSNIYKYAMPGTRVYIDMNKTNKGVIIEIKNISSYSLNISPSELIERFKRGDDSRNTEGSGLGLSIASSFIEAQGGTFNIEIDGDLFKTVIFFK